MVKDLSSDREILRQLNVKTQDELAFFGARSQAALRECSGEISSYVSDGSGVERVLREISERLTTEPEQKKSGGLLGRLGIGRLEESRSLSLEELKETIEALSVQLQLQEAELIKTNAILGRLKEAVKRTQAQLEELTELGKNWLNEYKRGLDSVGAGGAAVTGGAMPCDLSSEARLIARMESKLQDLEISRIVAAQTEAQLKLMEDNNSKIIIKTQTAISQTIPLWRNQVNIIMASESIRRQIKASCLAQELAGKRVGEAAEALKSRALDKDSTEFSGGSRGADGDAVCRLEAATRSLSGALQELREFELKDGELRRSMSELFEEKS